VQVFSPLTIDDFLSLRAKEKDRDQEILGKREREMMGENERDRERETERLGERRWERERD